MGNKCKTPAAAAELGVSYHRVINLIRFGKIPPPQRDGSGDFWWGDADLRRVRKALEKGRRKGTATAK